MDAKPLEPILSPTNFTSTSRLVSQQAFCNNDMKRVTDTDIENMRARGFDGVTIEQALDKLEHGKLADELIDEIADAFKGVVLGDGIGLQEAQGLDDDEDKETCAALREGDEKKDWGKISCDDLNRCNSSLSFFNAEGMRFHLPAYLTAELRGDYGFGMAFSLTHLNNYTRSQFTALSPEQRKVIRDFLLFLRDDPDYEFDLPQIDHALTDFWTEVHVDHLAKAEQGVPPNDR